MLWTHVKEGPGVKNKSEALNYYMVHNQIVILIVKQKHRIR